MTKYTPEEIKNRLSNIGEAIGSIALEYIVELEKEKEQLKAENAKLKCCQNCSYFLLRLLENEVYVPYCCENDKYLTTEKVCNKWR